MRRTRARRNIPKFRQLKLRQWARKKRAATRATLFRIGFLRGFEKPGSLVAATAATATIATAAASSAAATTATAAAPTIFARTCFIHGQRPALMILFVESLDRGLRFLVRTHF